MKIQKNIDFDVICIKEFLQLRNLFNEKKIITYSTIGIFKEEKDFINLVDADIKRIIQKHFLGKKIEKSPAYGDIEMSFRFYYIKNLDYYDLQNIGEIQITFKGLENLVWNMSNTWFGPHLNHFNRINDFSVFDRGQLWKLQTRGMYIIAKSDPKINFIETFDDGLGYIIEHLNAKEQ